eukprot:CAMPEP_0181075078 /NCGR_PEP_ID=MMETSP1070-20121207/29925_1 /TAXON_ID=265543 /ORGANISM="Minutocellus polymorphus, Strain NH13" /LENGTH=254 /DNA_ID=CAMNT_0023156201 /DNA_START=110 /DNA_END=874 /DNA_ORIENTATION=+
MNRNNAHNITPVFGGAGGQQFAATASAYPSARVGGVADAFLGGGVADAFLGGGGADLGAAATPASGFYFGAQQQHHMVPSLNGTWILDKRHGQPTMRGHLEALGVDKSLMDEQDKIDQTYDVVHEIHLTPTTLTVMKYNPRSGKMEMATDVMLGMVKAEAMRGGGEHSKTTLARSHDMSHIRVEVRLPTSGTSAINLLDMRSMEQSEYGPVMVQTLSTHDEQSGKHYTTTRYFLPYQAAAKVPAPQMGAPMMYY